jgi:uncharacterized membrane protein YdjX (TVP38/TMEM64 family)
MLHRPRCFAGAFLLTCLFAAALFTVIPGSPLKPGLLASLAWLRTVPTLWSAFAFTLLQSLAIVLAMPATPFNLAAGYLYTVWLGSMVSLLSLNLAGVVSFLVARYIARRWAEAQLDKRPAFRALDTLIGQHGFYVVFLITLTPVFPSGICYYLFGVSNVSFVAFLVATSLGLLPGTVAITYVGSLMGDVAEIFTEHRFKEAKQQVVWLAMAAITTVFTLALLGVIAKRALQHAMQVDEGKRDDGFCEISLESVM